MKTTTTTTSINDLIGKLDENLQWVNENALTLTDKKITQNNRTQKLNLTYNNKYRVVVSTTHDKERKCYRTYVSLVEVEFRANNPYFVIEKSIGSIFSDLFAKVIRTTECKRFSQSSFDVECANARNDYNAISNDYEKIITHLLNGTGVITN